MPDVNWLGHWGRRSYPDESMTSKNAYDAFLENYIRAWLHLINSRRRPQDRYQLRHHRFDRANPNHFDGTALLDPEVVEGAHPPGEETHPDFLTHLIPSPPPPPPRDSAIADFNRFLEVDDKLEE